MPNIDSTAKPPTPVPGDATNLLTVAAHLRDEYGIAAPTLADIVSFALHTTTHCIAVAHIVGQMGLAAPARAGSHTAA